MEYEIYHHGVKGQKWGIRRYQKKDGSLTRLGKKRRQADEDEQKKQEKEQAKEQKAQAKAQKAQEKTQKKEAQQQAKAQKAQEKLEKERALEAEQKKQQEQEAAEAREKIRAKLLNSNNAQEIYENRHFLTTQEINERLTRIDAEKRLGAEAAKSKVTFGDKVQKVVDKASKTANTIETAYQITQKPFYKALMKKVKGEQTPKTSKFDMDELLKKVDTMSTKELTDTLNRTKNINSIEALMQQIKNRRNTTTP